MQIEGPIAAEQDDELERRTSIVRPPPMHDQILPQLRRDIIENRWRSGERLSEPLLCREFGVSRTPLRAALTTLETEGLVRLIPHVGAVVTDPDEDEVGERMEILIGLEQLAATRVTEAADRAVLDEIESIQREMNAAARSKDANRYYALNDEFHLAFVRGTRNRSLVDLHEKVMWHVHRERHRVNFGEEITGDSAGSHTEILRALRKREAEEAGLAMRRHLEHVSLLMRAHRQKLSAGPSASPATPAKPSAARRGRSR